MGSLAFWYALSNMLAARCDPSLASDGALSDIGAPDPLPVSEFMLRSRITSLLPAVKPSSLLPMRFGSADRAD